MTIMSKIIIMRMGVPVSTSIKSTAAPVPMTTIMRKAAAAAMTTIKRTTAAVVTIIIMKKAAPAGITMTGTPGASC